MFRKLLLAASFVLAAPVVASAATVHICGAGATPGPYDVATGDTFSCELTFEGAAATNGSVVLDFESSAVPFLAAATTANLGGVGTTFATATLEWFDRPSNTSLGSVALTDILGIGFGGVLGTSFDGPGTPDEQYVVLSWTGFNSNGGDDILNVSIQVAAVPLPAGALLLIGGLGGLAAMRRRKTKAAVAA